MASDSKFTVVARVNGSDLYACGYGHEENGFYLTREEAWGVVKRLRAGEMNGPATEIRVLKNLRQVWSARA